MQTETVNMSVISFLNNIPPDKEEQPKEYTRFLRSFHVALLEIVPGPAMMLWHLIAHLVML